MNRREEITGLTAAPLPKAFLAAGRQLVRRPSPVGWIDAATHGNRMAARRYREAMRPMGWRHAA